MRNLKVVTKETEERFWGQEDEERWNYEMKNLTELLLSDDYDTIYKKLDITLDTVEVMENVRKAAGIYFPGDK